jgi:hypothetical protein
MKYAHYDTDNGSIIGFYDDDVHEAIPSPNLQLTDDEYEQANQGRKKVLNGLLVDDAIVMTYVDKRTAEYPPMSEYLDAIVKDDADAIQAYKNACLAVKAKYPKE